MSGTFLFDGQPVPVTDGQTILQAARAAGHYIPHLCWHPDFPPHGSCKLCIVKVAGRHVSSCAMLAKEGMEVESNTPEINGKRRALLADPDLRSGELLTTGTGPREGVGIIEAPRGILIHHYRIGEDDLVTMCNLIVSSTHNNQAMNTAVREVAKRYLSGRTLTEGLLNRIEVAIRAYDPCLSCATHALGQMPLVVELVCTDGTVHQRLERER